jgi:hypothetical protein
MARPRSARPSELTCTGLGLELDGAEDNRAAIHGRGVAECLALAPRLLFWTGILRRQPVPEGRRGRIEFGRLIEDGSDPLLRHATLQPVDEHDEFDRLAVAVGQLWELRVQNALEQIGQECRSARNRVENKGAET